MSTALVTEERPRSFIEVNSSPTELNGFPVRLREIVKLFDISSSTIKFYESKGLLNPHRVNGQRIYTQDHYNVISFILKLKTFDLSIGEIRDVIVSAKNHSREGLDAALTMKRCEDKIAALTEERKKIDSILSELQSYVDLKRARS
jgi:DNA-binding transcriptional MerR regulator